MRTTLVSGLTVFLVASLGHADVTTIATRTQTFQNTDCAETQSCDLKTFTLTQDDYKLDDQAAGLLAFGTRMHLSYETSSLDTLESYGIAQFIEGCQYDSQLRNGQVENVMDVAIEHYGKTVPFHFPDEVIDGFVPDPLDWGDVPGAVNRFFFYLNKPIGSAEPGSADYYGNEKATEPILYLRDMPGAAQVFGDGTARNISLRFRDCVYKAAEVPKSVPDSQTDFARPLTCFSWNSSFVYDFQSKAFQQPGDVVMFCR